MNPTITLPRQHGSTAGLSGAGAPGSRSDGLRMPRFFKRLFKFPQMDFELAIWEMTSLLIAPKKVFRSIYYHKQTKNTYHRADPSFSYLLALLLLLTGLAWGIAYTSSAGATIRLTLIFIFVHFLLGSLLLATAYFFLVSRILGPQGVRLLAGVPGRKRRGLFPQSNRRDGASAGGAAPLEEGVEFGYCFDVAVRAFFPVWVWLYVIQFVLWPVISRGNWASLFFGNTLYLVAMGYYTVITFLGYNALPFLHHTELILSPGVAFGVIWLISLFGFNIPRHVGPLLLLGAR